jgi:hypothetical protein
MDRLVKYCMASLPLLHHWLPCRDRPEAPPASVRLRFLCIYCRENHGDKTEQEKLNLAQESDALLLTKEEQCAVINHNQSQSLT